MATKPLTRKQIEQIVDERNKAMVTCFEKLTQDLDSVKTSTDRIERVLLGDKDFHDDGIIERLLPVVNHWEKWQQGKKWDRLNTMMEDNIVSERLKVFFGIGTFAGIIALVLSLGLVFKWVADAGIFVK